MRVLFVAPWYGSDGFGAGRQCRELAIRLAGRGHEVEVATSCSGPRAERFHESAFPPGTTAEDDVTVHRFASRAPRDDRFYLPLRSRVFDARGPVASVVEHDWMRMRGPDLPELPAFLQARSASDDIVACFSYDRVTSYDGLRALAGLVPTVLHPLVTESGVLDRGIFAHLFRLADAFAWNTEEEHRLVGERFGVGRPSVLMRPGIELAAPDATSGDLATFRTQIGLGTNPYVLGVVGTDGGQARGLVEMFNVRRARVGDDVALVLVGRRPGDLDVAPGVVHLGRPERPVLSAAIAGCRALLVPTYDEHVVPVLLDAWARGRPAVVDGSDRRLLALAHGSGGALPYTSFAEFEAAMDVILTAPDVGAALGEAGRRHVDARHRWDDVLARYEGFLEDLSIQWRSSTWVGARSAG